MIFQPPIHSATNVAGLLSILSGKYKSFQTMQRDQALMHLAPVASLAYWLATTTTEWKSRRVAVVGDEQSNRIRERKFFGLLSSLMGLEEPLSVCVFTRSSGMPLESALLDEVFQVEEGVCSDIAPDEFDVVFWPSPSMSFEVDEKETLNWVLRAHRQGARVIALHFNRFDAALESIFLEPQGLTFSVDPSQYKNPFSLIHESFHWGAVFSEIASQEADRIFPEEPEGVFGVIAQMEEENAESDNIFEFFGRELPSTLSKDILLQRIHAQLSINLGQLALFAPHGKSGQQRIGYLAESFAEHWRSQDAWSSGRAKVALAICAARGIPFSRSYENQEQFESRLQKFADSGSELANLILGGFMERKERLNDAIRYYKKSKSNPYSAYGLGFLILQVEGAGEEALTSFLEALELGLGCAAMPLLQIISRDADKSRWSQHEIETILREGERLQDPDTMCYLAETAIKHNQPGMAVSALKPAVLQLDVKAMELLASLPRELWCNDKTLNKALKIHRK